ncbi:SDR family oxidoreductase [Glaciimonas sp. CA11.2]|uniref:SDR family oxidoreductase n=1 Tax=unclassified Glaciimonas TaxID=2644401 RepID=UPI002AB3322B|nr:MULTISPECIES: SDR family oxidoreductase [unclassified Glaciimonas]MDY7548922.1 SDR family oxidoreductase [Glaciimonas sp. CA11.2]MEB0013620.1 SDR family oxidoreductase [Glaciimonas sp. Cout2]MEB0083646.1 SDR family oxidoreductase [Glaciimonas sp. Gout2]MEB0162981.1 SDR family oxidoreductase [Glaciimonas sp. CA11.2]
MAKSVLVTGATRGIGRAIAEQMAADGYEVIGIARNPVPDFRGHLYQCDLDDPIETQVILEKICRLHEITIVVNNVGAVAVETVGTITSTALSQQWRVNVEASVMTIQAALPAMKKNQWGRIVNIASGAVLGKAGRAGYSASKAALLGLTRTLAIELGPFGISANCIAPGQILTELWASNNQPDSQQTRAMVASIPRRRLGKPEDVASAVSYLVSEQADYVTGQTLYVCGGLTVGRNYG